MLVIYDAFNPLLVNIDWPVSDVVAEREAHLLFTSKIQNQVREDINRRRISSKKAERIGDLFYGKF